MARCMYLCTVHASLRIFNSRVDARIMKLLGRRHIDHFGELIYTLICTLCVVCFICKTIPTSVEKTAQLSHSSIEALSLENEAIQASFI